MDPSAWSAVTIPVEGTHVVVVNDAHGEARQESNLHHEAAHLLCGHKPADMKVLGGFAFRVFDETAEAEAAWLGGCLHLPRAALLQALRRGHDEPSIGERFVASAEMVRWRRSMTGVDRQLRQPRPS